MPNSQILFSRMLGQLRNLQILSRDNFPLYGNLNVSACYVFQFPWLFIHTTPSVDLLFFF